MKEACLSLNTLMVLKIYSLFNIRPASLRGQVFPHFMEEETHTQIW